MDIYGVFSLLLSLIVCASTEITIEVKEAAVNNALECQVDEKPPEGCDCVPKQCNKDCCDKTCKLLPNAECAFGACCDVKTCRVKQLATICRIPANACDLPEYCDGISFGCRNDVFKSNFEKCQDENSQELYCFKGNCSATNPPSLAKNLTCPNNCNGNGVCNSLGHCHCLMGFGGDSCAEVGRGGSIDSGPATTYSNIFHGFPNFAYLAFIAAIPIIVTLNFCVCFLHKKISISHFREPSKYHPSNASASQEYRSKASIENLRKF